MSGARIDGGVSISPARYDAVVFDMDGVITDTARVHAQVWKRLFDQYLTERAGGQPVTEFDADQDYRRFVDGKPREAGVLDFLASRGIVVPRGEPTDPPDSPTAFGLGARKDGYFNAQVERFGVTAYPSTIALVHDLHDAGIKTAVITSSRNCELILRGAGVADLFPVRVDGALAAELGLPGKPDPAVFLEAARRLGAIPDRTVVVEDALSGVEAGRQGGFALVIGVDRTGDAEALRGAGADVVVADLQAVTVDDFAPS
ncbi:MAG: HAD-IA family hydrolase [Dermatophilaceae bacterium]